MSTYSSVKILLKNKAAIETGIKRFHATGLFLYPLRASENPWFYVCNGYRKRPMA